MKEFQTEERGPGRQGYGKERTQRQLERAGYTKDPRIDAFAQTVDFDTMRDVFGDLFERSGGKRSDMNFISPDHLVTSKHTLGVASYHPDQNVIAFSKDPTGELRFLQRPLFFEPIKGTRYFGAPDIDDATFQRIHSLGLLAHEEAHAVSFAGLEYRDRLFGFLSEITTHTSGYKKTEYEERLLTSRWRAVGEIINEGVTELVARDVLQEYVRRKGSDEFGVTPKQVQKYVACADNDLFQIAFGRKQEVEFVRIFIEYAAEVAERPREEIWSSLVRGFIRGGNIFDPSIEQAFAEKRLEKILAAFGSSDAKLSMFPLDAPQAENKKRDRAIAEVNATLFADLAKDSQEYLYSLFDDFSGVKVKKVRGDWISFAQMQDQLQRSSTNDVE